MATTVLSVSEEWTAEGRYTAASAVDILLSNTQGGVQRFLITTDDTIPAPKPAEVHPLEPREKIPMQLNAGERLWVAGDVGKAAVEE